jgi:hypothetical protein
MIMTGGQSHGARYYYLSYASTPRSEDRFAGDSWVRLFYRDLNTAINARPGERSRRPGFAEFTVDSPRERPGQRRIALAEAEVFLPLYSPDYLDSEESRKEREAFRQRMVSAGRPADGDNLLPVLWTPWPSTAHAVDRNRALSVAPNITAYADNGMSALCRLREFRNVYLEILGKLAQHIVDTAERSPVRPGALVPDPVDVPQPQPSAVPFLVVIIAPESVADASGRAQRNGYFGDRDRL